MCSEFALQALTRDPKSKDRPDSSAKSARCGYSNGPLVLSEADGAKNKFYYTYRHVLRFYPPFMYTECAFSVYWEESSTPWATRWDNYLRVYDPKIHTFSLINSLVMVVFLCAIVSSLLLRSVKGDVGTPIIVIDYSLSTPCRFLDIMLLI